MLYGVTSERLRTMRDRGYRTRAYVPYGREWYLFVCHRLAEYPPNIHTVALGLRIKSGRFLDAADRTASTIAFVVNEEFLRVYLNDGQPVVGRRFPGLFNDRQLAAEIVGVVGNVLKDGPDRLPQPELYLLVRDDRRGTRRDAFVVLRTSGDPLAVAPDLRRIVREIDPRIALDGVGRLSDGLSSAVADRRFAAVSLVLFSGLALAVAATGLYGVLSYSISQRRREMGVRSALGASRWSIIALVVRQGLITTVLGVAIGIAAASAASRFVTSLLFGIAPLDPVAFVTAALAVLAVALAASFVPAWRTAAIAPADALPTE
jgi:hypothetical protein